MSEKITWTHVDAHVRREHERRGMVPTGMTDAEVTKSYVTWLERMLLSAQRTLEGSQRELDSTHQQLAEALTTKSSKTKTRLAALEKAVEELQLKPSLPVYGPRGQCRVHGCADPAVTPDGLCNGHFE